MCVPSVPLHTFHLSAFASGKAFHLLPNSLPTSANYVVRVGGAVGVLGVGEIVGLGGVVGLGGGGIERMGGSGDIKGSRGSTVTQNTVNPIF